MTALNLPIHNYLLSWNRKQLGGATLLENALKEWQNVTLSRCVDTFNVPSPRSHYRAPYAYAWTTFFFSITLHSSTVRADCKTQENSALGWLEGGTPRHVDGCKGWTVRAIFICHEVTRECNTCETGETACQSNSVEAPKMAAAFKMASIPRM